MFSWACPKTYEPTLALRTEKKTLKPTDLSREELLSKINTSLPTNREGQPTTRIKKATTALEYRLREDH